MDRGNGMPLAVFLDSENKFYATPGGFITNCYQMGILRQQR
ncbi:hypothetical protein D3OALGB2SA_639 [Olavius algarvensis associated proteobacterium Delta 3]|nr:hypothetical protein D3OALGB2SA_639 [Olavius algarvensis associated proteobacterium Delta 3]